MNKKNTISADRTKLRLEIRELTAKYQMIAAKKEIYGVIGVQMEEELFEVINSIGMRYAKDGYLEQAQIWLKKAEEIVHFFPKFKIILHSNLACVYKKKQNYNHAKEHLFEAQKCAILLRDKKCGGLKYDRLLIDCWLNMCALFSSQGNHEQALETVKKALALMSDRIREGCQKFYEQYLIGKYNEAVELQHLGKADEAFFITEDSKRFLNEKRIYGSFMQKNILKLHQSLRTKVIAQSQHKRRMSSVMPITQKMISDYSTLKSSTRISKFTENVHMSIQEEEDENQKKQNKYFSIGYTPREKNVTTKGTSIQKRKISIRLLPSSKTVRNVMSQITNNN